MESTQAKIAIFVSIVLALGVCLGLALMKFSQGMQPSEADSRLTPQQRLERLEKSNLNTDRTRNLIDRGLEREKDTKAAEDAAYGSQ